MKILNQQGSEQVVAMIVGTDGNPIWIRDGYAIDAATNSLIVSGSDGYNAHFLKTTTAGEVLTIQQAHSAHRASVSASLSSVQLIAANTNRKGLKIYNDSSSGVLYIGYGSSVTSTDFTLAVPTGALFELTVPMFTGAIHGLWTAADGAALLTEIF